MTGVQLLRCRRRQAVLAIRTEAVDVPHREDGETGNTSGGVLGVEQKVNDHALLFEFGFSL